MKIFAASSWLAFFKMGGYAEYVWPAYGIVTIVLVYQVWQAYRKFRIIKKNQRQKIHETTS